MTAGLALAALVLLPGLLVVRGPWTVVCPLSLAFWALSAWWPPLVSLSRGRVVAAFLVVAAGLALLRLWPKHEVAPPSGWVPPPPDPPATAPLAGSRPRPRLGSAVSVLVLAAGLLPFAPVSRWHHAPGPRMAFQTTAARLLLWRDGIPQSAEPLLPLAPFGAHAPAIASLAADLSSLSGLDPGRSVLLVFLVAAGLTVVGFFALGATWLPPEAAAPGVFFGLALALSSHWLDAWGTGEGLLCLAFVLPATALLLGHHSRSSAVAAGMLFGAGSLAHPLLAAAAWAAIATLRPGRLPGPPGSRRGGLAATTAALLAAPGLWPALGAISAHEVRQIVVSGRLSEVAAFLAGCVCLGLGLIVGRSLVRSRSRRAQVGLGALGAAVLAAAVVGSVDGGQLPADRLVALARVGETTSIVGRVCASPVELDWVPALAGRAPGEPGPWIPAIYQEEWARRDRRPCTVVLEGPSSL